MNTTELESIYGRSIRPGELGKFLGLDRRTVIKYADKWGGVQVSPGRYRFFENRIKEILNDAWFSNQTWEKTLEGQHHGRGRVAPKIVSGRNKEVLPRSRGMGDRTKGEDRKEENRHGLLDDLIMV
ncbi:MAG: hypothetical protein H8E10_17280 [Desulfobacterales bacterium]|nr:hypothetical protein [Desulfobacterales bacterium]